AFNCERLASIAGKLATCPDAVALSFATSIMGFTELADRLAIVPTSATDELPVQKAKTLGILPGPQMDVACALLNEVSCRTDIASDFRTYIREWLSRKQRVFAPTARTEYLDHKQAFSGLKEEYDAA